MKQLFLTLSLFLSTLLQGQDMSNSIGIITISESYDNTDRKIEFLNNDGSTWMSMDLYQPFFDNNSEFKIIAFKPDYFLFKIRCTEETLESYTVVVNEVTGLTKRIEKTDKIRFNTWEEYVLDVFSIGFDTTKISIHDSIDGPKTQELPHKESVIIPREIRGDWMRIDWSKPGDYSFKPENMIHGWIRWKSGNKIIIYIYHLS